MEESKDVLELQEPLDGIVIPAVQEIKEQYNKVFFGKVEYDETERGCQVWIWFDNPNIPKRLITVWQLEEYDKAGEWTHQQLKERVYDLLSKE